MEVSVQCIAQTDASYTGGGVSWSSNTKWPNHLQQYLRANKCSLRLCRRESLGSQLPSFSLFVNTSGHLTLKPCMVRTT